MEQRKNIGQIITEAFSSEEVKKRIEEFGDISEGTACLIVLYCTIMKNSQIPKKLLHMVKFDYTHNNYKEGCC